MAGPDDSEGGDVSSSEVSNGVSMVKEGWCKGRFALLSSSDRNYCYASILYSMTTITKPMTMFRIPNSLENVFRARFIFKSNLFI
jgi:hypothetical protein